MKSFLLRQRKRKWKERTATKNNFNDFRSLFCSSSSCVMIHYCSFLGRVARLDSRIYRIFNDSNFMKRIAELKLTLNAYRWLVIRLSCRCRTLIEKSGAQSRWNFLFSFLPQRATSSFRDVKCLSVFHNADCALHTAADAQEPFPCRLAFLPIESSASI